MCRMNEWTGQNTDAFAVMSRQEARAFDQYAIETLGIPGIVLMENAGRRAAEVLLALPDWQPQPRTVVFCGTGNNGGDGFVIARHLANTGCAVKTVLCGDRQRLSGDARVNCEICRRMEIPSCELDPETPELPKQVQMLTTGCDVIVDALFGTGLRGQLAEPFAALISALNAAAIPRVAVDIPSGLDCDAGWPLPVSIEAAATITFGGLKRGFVQNPESRNATGRVFVASIGVEPTR